MCLAIGVDPLQSTKNELSFYSELGIQVLTMCLSTR